jgi:hypothetical protein
MTNISNVIMPHVEMVIFTVIDSSDEMTNITNVIMPHIEMLIFTVIDSSGEMTNITNVIMHICHFSTTVYYRKYLPDSN